MKIEVLEVARQEFDEAYAYYESQRAGLGEEFRMAVRVEVMKIQAHPEAWMLIRPGIRKCLGAKFPYDIIYQKLAGRVLILALAHKKRKPLYWANRTRTKQ